MPVPSSKAPPINSLLVALVTLALLASPAPAQLPEESPPLDEIRAAISANLAGLEGATDPDSPERARATSILTGALDEIAAAQGIKAETLALAELLSSAPAQLVGIRGQTALALESLDSTPPPPATPPSAGELQQSLAASRASVTRRNEALATLSEQLDALKARPEELGREEQAAREILSSQPPPDAPPGSPPYLFHQARLARARATLAAAQQEELTFSSRREILEARIELAAAELAAAEEELARVERLAVDQRQAEADRFQKIVAESAAIAADQPPEFARLLGEMDAHTQKLFDLNREIRAADFETASTIARRNRAQSALQRIRSNVEAGGSRGVLGQLLIQERRRLPDPRLLRLEARQRAQTMADNRLWLLSLDEAAPPTLRRQRHQAAQADEETPELVALRQQHAELTRAVANGGERFADALNSLDRASSELLHITLQSRAYLLEKSLWTRTSSAIGPATFSGLPEALSWCFGHGRLAQLRDAMLDSFSTYPARHGTGIALLVALFALAPRCRRTLASSARALRRIATDSYSATLAAALATLILALPIPLIAAGLGASLFVGASASPWQSGMSLALLAAAPLLLLITLLSRVCREDGLARAHFQWHQKAIATTRLALHRVAPLLPIGHSLAVLTTADPTGQAARTLGQLALLFTLAALAALVAQIFHPKLGVLAFPPRRGNPGFLFRLRFLWPPLLLLLIAATATLAASGFFLAAINLMSRLGASAMIIVAAILAHATILRWFSMTKRRLLLAHRLRERQERVAAEDTQDAPHAEEASIGEIEEETINLAEVDSKTRSLLAFLVGLTLAISLWASWSTLVPALGAISSFAPFGALTIGQLAAALIIVAITYSVANNLPAFIEFALLGRLKVDGGSRYAITTLCRYAILVIGAASLFSTLGTDWEKLGWVAAALSVGLGFGLQEIVANFVSGIILLFERPIRVGDIVTIGQETGVVTRIQMRATTLTNWDRKELIIPNKELITGQILNWTLTSQVNRVLVEVGVAYGSDLDLALETLSQIAQDHPLIVADPPPVSCVERFGDSQVSLSLRCYLPDMENRLATITALHLAIAHRFRAAGIEIPFPQRDIHISTPGMAPIP